MPSQKTSSWAGTELGEIANAVIRQILKLNLRSPDRLNVQSGEPHLNARNCHAIAPKAKLIPEVNPRGAALLGMEASGLCDSETTNQIKDPYEMKQRLFSALFLLTVLLTFCSP
jgi:hypothetical protein